VQYKLGDPFLLIHAASSPQVQIIIIVIVIIIIIGARGSVVRWGTMLQNGRSQVRFPLRSSDFSIDLTLPAALWPWGRLSL
jgi:hypothetical protein